MRWELLFRDLEAEFAAARADDLAAEVADRTRYELGRLRLVDRLRPAVGHPVTVRVPGAGVVAGRVSDVGPDWLLLAGSMGQEKLVPLARVQAVSGLGGRSAEPGSEGQVDARFDLRFVLRGMARSRTPCRVVLLDGAVLGGTLDRVGADFVELAEHPDGEVRRWNAVRAIQTVSLPALTVLTSAADI